MKELLEFTNLLLLTPKFKGDVMLIFRFITLRVLSVFSWFSVAAIYSLSVLAPVSLRAPFPDTCAYWSAHTRPSQHLSPCLPLALSCFQLPGSLTSAINIGINDANEWHGDLVWCQEVTELKAGLHTRCLSCIVFCGREKLPIVPSLGLSTVKTVYMHKSLYNTRKEKKLMGLLKEFSIMQPWEDKKKTCGTLTFVGAHWKLVLQQSP